jgi:hypothetical protein
LYIQINKRHANTTSNARTSFKYEAGAARIQALCSGKTEYSITPIIKSMKDKSYCNFSYIDAQML